MSAFSEALLALSPDAYWPMQEGAGATTDNVVGTALASDLAVPAGVSWATGVGLPVGLKDPGADNAILCPGGAGVGGADSGVAATLTSDIFAADVFSVLVWIFVTTLGGAGEGTVFGTRNGGFSLEVTSANDVDAKNPGTGTYFSVDGAFPNGLLNGWHMFTAVQASTANQKIWIDDDLIYDDAGVDISATGGLEFSFGSYHHTSFGNGIGNINGNIAHGALWETAALDASDIADLLAASVTSPGGGIPGAGQAAALGYYYL